MRRSTLSTFVLSPASLQVRLLLVLTDSHERVAHVHRHLLNNGADWTLVDEEGRSALHYAVTLESTKCLAAIVRMVVDTNVKALDLQDKNAMTAMVRVSKLSPDRCISASPCLEHVYDLTS